MTFRLPGPTERTVVFGRTGSGKTVFLTWLLSMQRLDARPWIVLDLKRDLYLRGLPRIEPLEFGKLPRHPGLYYMPVLTTQFDDLDSFLYKILSKGNIGLFCDEGASIPQQEPSRRGLKALFSQGRSLRIPILLATQRPAWVNQSILSEGDYYAAFHLSHAPDRKRVGEFMPGYDGTRLDDYHSRWYDVKQDRSYVLGPANEAEAMERIEDALRPATKLI